MATPVEADFDHHDPAWLANRHAHNDALRARSPVVWNPRYGGFWYVVGYDEVAAVARDSTTFTPRYDPDGAAGVRAVGIMGVPRPAGLPPAAIAEADGPRHRELRRLLNPRLLPAAVEADRPLMADIARWFLDQKIASGAMDLVADLTSPVPAVLTMRLVGLAADRWEDVASVFHGTLAFPPGSAEHQAALGRIPDVVAELRQLIADRRRSPAGDVVSQLTALEADGQRLGDDEIVGVLWNLIGGGLDTTTSLTSLALHYLAHHLELRERLAADLDLLPVACEEFLRFTTVNETLTRTATCDTELGGQRIRRGDVVMVSWLAADFDPAVFDRPHEVDVDRHPNPHLAFGVGAHRCIGLHVARQLFVVLVAEVLRRIPDYRPVPGQTSFYEGNPELTGVVRMPVTFTPGSPTGQPRPF
jgi:cytochrome P450